MILFGEEFHLFLFISLVSLHFSLFLLFLLFPRAIIVQDDEK